MYNGIYLHAQRILLDHYIHHTNQTTQRNGPIPPFPLSSPHLHSPLSKCMYTVSTY